MQYHFCHAPVRLRTARCDQWKTHPLVLFIVDELVELRYAAYVEDWHLEVL